MAASGVAAAVVAHDTPTLFDWMLGLFQLQGISDRNAVGFTAAHGTVGSRGLERKLATGGRCPHLTGFDAFSGCGFKKSTWSCAEPGRIDLCALPRLPFRNGRLSQNAVAFFLFVRDVCRSDLVGWIDAQPAGADELDATDRTSRLRQALIEPLTRIHGLGPKVSSMVLADLLLRTDPGRERWIAADASMIAVDTLVHNFLHRTGILADADGDHVYGPGCYGPNGCAAVIERFANTIDARRYAPDFPMTFPRFVQHAIWRFCAADEWDVCNGNRIDDRYACTLPFCPIRRACARETLHRTTVVRSSSSKSTMATGDR